MDFPCDCRFAIKPADTKSVTDRRQSKGEILECMILDCNPFKMEIDDARESTKSLAGGIQDVSPHL